MTYREFYKAMHSFVVFSYEDIRGVFGTFDMREKEHEISLFLINRENALRVSSFYDYVSGLDFDALCENRSL